ncbi:hypothetical protein GOBAR_AA30387 [Gossypium barbadense]|uniref:Uncharacterized protein n=1 Tax=Gossypium barbadense TaxID=3634 RepID=A0A2P5WGS4_GOSBA|nr:hypothetical protein GOBAR_AA30387 [Gossypium barbadense]
MKRSPFKLVILASHRTLKKLSFKEVHETCFRNDREHIHEEPRLRIEELDEWRAHKSKTHDKLKLHQNKPDTSPNQLKVGDKVLLDAADPHIVTTTPNEKITLTVLSIFPFGMVEHTQPGTRAYLKPWPNRGRDTAMQYGRVEARYDFPKTRDAINPHGRATWPWVNLIGTLCHHREAIRSWSHPQRDVRDRILPRHVLQKKFGTHSLSFRKLRKRIYFKYYARDPSLQVVMTNNDDPGTIHFRLGGLVHTMSVPEFGVTLGLYTNEFMEEEDMNALPRNIHISPSLCWKALAPLSSTYDPSRSKASALAPSLRYLYATLAHTFPRRRESTSIVNTHDAYYLWCMANAHVTDLAYFIAFVIRHQTERHWKGVISTDPYVTCLARHFGLLNTVAQSSALTLIGQMSP